ncbi:MAG: ferrous iron transporter B [Clostridiales Family XIII bacterium]|jgi:ferrous iron transport protein B|nr:ferrous iron transporter B [Clostridiales Family XIII bacterium]
MSIKIALAGNPNSGKTTLFNALTGSNQFVGNWPGVTVEKKEGNLKNHKDVVIIDLPGIYSLSPYTLEEVVARNYLIDERPDAILNIIDGTNLERNLYLTTQFTELGIPVVVAVNMMDVVRKNGDKLDTARLSKELGCQVIEISALKGESVMQSAELAINASKLAATLPQHSFSGGVEHTLAHIEEAVLHNLPEERQRWYSIKLFERDPKIIEKLELLQEQVAHIESDIKTCETEFGDDSESIITAERYTYIDSIIKDCRKIKNKGKLSASDKIDKVVTNRFLALPIFAAVMFLIYFVSITSVGTIATDWANDGVFGDGWHLAGIGSSAYGEAAGDYESEQAKIDAFLAAAEESGIDTAAMSEVLETDETDEALIKNFIDEASASEITAYVETEDEEGNVIETLPVSPANFETALTIEEPDPADYGIWIPGIPVLLGSALEAINCADWLQALILDGIIAGVGAVLGFVPQMLILFMFLAFLEGCGYMARIAFIMDRIFRRFGLSGKSFIPILIGTGCGVPGIMSSRTIESERDRRMTVITTTFIPCSAKLPIIALIAGALFGGAWWVGGSAYFIGITAIICSGIILKKTKLFSGDVAPFVMELPTYHWPTVGSILRSMWERGWSFIKKAGTIILLATIFVWFTSSFGLKDGSFGMVDMSDSILANLGSAIAWIFAPLGWGNWKSAVAAITGLIAKENVVGTFGILFGFAEVSENGTEIWGRFATSFTTLTAFSFLVFNLLCAPCFAAMGAIKREMNNVKWFWIAVGYECGFAYIVSLCIYQFGMLFSSGYFGGGTVVAFVLLGLFLWLLLRPYPKDNSLKSNNLAMDA